MRRLPLCVPTRRRGGGSTLEGLIKDDSGPLLGATVIVKNTTRGTTTDMDGKFRLEGLQPGDVLQVTYVGYDPYEVTYTGQTTLDILMTTTANQLNAVVVTAMVSNVSRKHSPMLPKRSAAMTWPTSSRSI